ncbi:DUF6542 domain-containing protein [[Mycobacterium] nativiensis]|uniref:DUF6542 domain-containing protein n=1 Tax=[Mycobacterium] nativiensis TaxID=2855503 RepID=A0ABU5XWV8_9MYCO|nr:DUF6542 domain-containing protein [Mycolicibacter sp. MYC340]MEB3031496.1 DUF6542 domain-containing protein [Mycolicibacter sp. MYC340]
MAAQREKSTVAADHRSILPNAAGLPWWGAVAVASVASAIGIAFNAGSGGKELTTVFSALYVMGCIAAVLTVRQSAVFTAVIQPPLILFCAVPSAYWMFHGVGFPGLKAILINCGYPLIERFPLMLFTAAAVLLVGMVRWYLGMLNHSARSDAEDSTRTRRRPPLVEKLSAMLTAALNRNPAHAIEQPASRTRRERPPSDRRPSERRPGERPRRATPEARRAAREGTASRSSRARSTESRRDTPQSAPTRSRHIRPPRDEASGADIPRRRRPAPDPRDEQMRRRRQEPGWRDEAPRRRTEPGPRGNRDPRTRGYRPAEPSESLPRRRPSAAGDRTNGSDAAHHPVSQVRYRKAAGDESGTQPPSRPRRPRNENADAWEYDI